MTNEEFLESISEEGEIWKDLIGSNGDYAVSSHGRFVSFYFKSPRILKTKICKHGYIRINIGERGRRTETALAHRIVAIHFIPNPNNLSAVDHINGDKQDNRVENLRWVTHKDNNANPITLSKLRNRVETLRGKPINLIKEGSVVKSYPSIRKASRDGYNRSTIQRSLNTGLTTRSGVLWAYAQTSIPAMSKDS